MRDSRLFVSADNRVEDEMIDPGGSGGIRTFAIQLAKHLRAYVAVTAGTDSIKYVKDLE